MRYLSIVGLVIAASAGLASPALAQGDSRCDAQAERIRSALANADAGVAPAATRRLRTGEKLCEANNRHAALKEFRVARKLLGIAEASPEAVASR